MVKISSFAKINLGIEVVRRLPDGYHQIRTLFQTISLFDRMEFRALKGDRIVLEGNSPDISWDTTNLIHRAALLLRERSGSGRGVHIRVEKNIPSGKGLGGGSSNAAVTLFVLNRMWGLGLDQQELLGLGRRLGADVPFFLVGGFCLGEGRGDDIRPREDPEKMVCLLALPPFSIPTASIYRQHRLSLTSRDKESKIRLFLERDDFGILVNELEETVFRLYPQLREIKALIQGRESVLSSISGTGSAVFGLFRSQAEAQRAAGRLTGIVPSVVVETVSRDRYWECLSTGV